MRLPRIGLLGLLSLFTFGWKISKLGGIIRSCGLPLREKRRILGVKRTTNPIESTFSTVKARTKEINGAGSWKAGLAMPFKLPLVAKKRWRRLNAPHLVALVMPGVEFPDGEAEMFQSEPPPEDLLTYSPSVFAASEVSTRNI